MVQSRFAGSSSAHKTQKQFRPVKWRLFLSNGGLYKGVYAQDASKTRDAAKRFMTDIHANTDAEYFLDITGDVCPMTFVRTKLLMEKMAPGERAEIRLHGDEPLINVPRSIREMGHTVVAMEPEDPARPDGPQRLVLEIAA